MKPILRPFLASIFMASLATTALATTPPEVIEAFKAYAAAEDAGDHEGAQDKAREAWQIAETMLGDHKLTGDLAFNYAQRVRTGVEKEQEKAAERAVELASFYGDDAPAVKLERGVAELTVVNGLGKESKVIRKGRKFVEHAEAHGLENSTFTGEILTLMAGAYSSRSRSKEAREASQRALTIFENATDGIRSAYPLHANLYSGYVLENDEDFMGAAMRYQKVMEMTDGLDPEEYSLVGTTLGRWIYMRSVLQSDGRLEEAEQAGLCKCWPYDKPRNEDVKPVKRVPPVMPREAMQSGYVVVEFDLADDGSVKNERVITAWPDYFEKPALKAVKKWSYAERTSEQDIDDRTDLVTTVRFRLTDQNGKIIW